MTANSIEARARRWRNFLCAELLIVGLQLLLQLLTGSQPRLAYYVVLFIAVGVGSLLWRRTDLVLDDHGMLHGPRRRSWSAGLFGAGRVSIPVSSIDRERSLRKAPWGGQVIWAVGGEAIVVDSIAIPRAERVALLGALGLNGGT